MKLRFRMWMGENAGAIGLLALSIWCWNLPLDLAPWLELQSLNASSSKTLGWAVGTFVAHSARSHTMRHRENSGQPQDWLAEFFTWVGAGTAVYLASNDEARILLGVPLGLYILMAFWRHGYRKWGKPLPSGSWAREDD